MGVSCEAGGPSVTADVEPQLLTATRVLASCVGDLPTTLTVPTPEVEAEWDLDPQEWLDYAVAKAAGTIRDHHVGTPETSVENAIVGLLADLHHAADAFGLPWDGLDEVARHRYWQDRNQ